MNEILKNNFIYCIINAASLISPAAIYTEKELKSLNEYEKKFIITTENFYGMCETLCYYCTLANSLYSL